MDHQNTYAARQYFFHHPVLEYFAERDFYVPIDELNRSPQESFKRLCAANHWGEGKINAEKDMLDDAVTCQDFLSGAGRQVDATGQADATESHVVAAFFKKYEFNRYTYDPSRPAKDELERLGIARRWGTKTMVKVSNEFRTLLEQSTGSVKKAFELAAKDSIRSPQVPANSTVRSSPNRIRRRIRPNSLSGTIRETTPIAQFFTRKSKSLDLQIDQYNERPDVPHLRRRYVRDRYVYEALSPEKEWNELTHAISHLFDLENNVHQLREKKKKDKRIEVPSYWKSLEHKRLKESYFAAVEEHFDWLINNRGGSAEEKALRPWEYLVELFGLGEAPIERPQAKEMLRTINVNIYNLIEYEEDRLDSILNAAQASINDLSLSTQTEKADNSIPKPTVYRNEETLAIYSMVTERVFPLGQASEGGTLVLLLKPIGQYFNNACLEKFMREMFNRVGSDRDSIEGYLFTMLDDVESYCSQQIRFRRDKCRHDPRHDHRGLTCVYPKYSRTYDDDDMKRLGWLRSYILCPEP